MIATFRQQLGAVVKQNSSRLFWLLYLIHFAVVWYMQVDIPYWDEWYLLLPIHGIDRMSFFNFITDPLMDSRLTLTYAQIWLFDLFTNWNLIYVGIFNYLLFGGILLLLSSSIRKVLSPKSHFLIPLILIPTLSPLSWEAHGWSQQSHTHFSVFFALLIAHLSFFTRLNIRSAILLSVSYLLLVFTWGRGLAAAPILLISWLAYHSLSKLMGKTSLSLKRSSLILFISTSCIISMLAYLGVIFFNPLPIKSSIHMIFQESFWLYFLQLIGFTFAWTKLDLIYGFISLLLIIAPVLISLGSVRFRPHKLSKRELYLITVILTWLGCTAAIALARSGQFPMHTAKSSRYAFPTLFLFPVVASYYLYLAQRARAPKILGILTFLMFGFAISGNQSTLNSANYENFYYKRKMAGGECIKNYLNGHEVNKPLMCPSISPNPDLRPAVKAALRRNSSFVTKLQQNKPLNTSFRRALE